jgi:hypothetical protein
MAGIRPANSERKLPFALPMVERFFKKFKSISKQVCLKLQNRGQYNQL